MTNISYPFATGSVSSDKILGDWYFDYSRVADKIADGFYGDFDAEGIPRVDYSDYFKKCKIPTAGKSAGFHYTPITIAHYAFGSLWKYNRFNEINAYKIFLKCAEWFCESVVRKNNYGVWEHTWVEPTYKLNPPWISAMVQGEALSLLLRAFQITERQIYRDVAELAYKSFHVPVSDGGISICDENQNIWFEEYPSNPPSYVLNGFIFAILGIHDYYRVTGDPESKTLWQNAIVSLKKRLPLYDSGFWSRYDLLTKTLTAPEYHFLHILQLQVVSALTGDEVFSIYKDQWENYFKSRISKMRRAIAARSSGKYWKNVLKRLTSI